MLNGFLCSVCVLFLLTGLLKRNKIIFFVLDTEKYIKLCLVILPNLSSCCEMNGYANRLMLSLCERKSFDRQQDRCQPLLNVPVNKDLIPPTPSSDLVTTKCFLCFTIWLTSHSGETKGDYGKINLFCFLKCGL